MANRKCNACPICSSKAFGITLFEHFSFATEDEILELCYCLGADLKQLRQQQTQAKERVKANLKLNMSISSGVRNVIPV